MHTLSFHAGLRFIVEYYSRSWKASVVLVSLLCLSGCNTLVGSSDTSGSGEVAAASTEGSEPEGVQAEQGLAQSAEIPANAPHANPMTAFCQGDHSVFKLSARDRARLHSICTAWYPGSSVPPLHYLLNGSESNWKSACKQAWNSPASERDFLKTALSINSAKDRSYPLCYFAILDWDGDGIRDYQVTNSGRFVENDVDIDQDGIPNVRDTNPVDPDVGEQISCGSRALPNHLKFACHDGSPHACELQQKLYKEFDVVVVNRDFVGTPELIESNLQTIYDAASLVLANGFSNHPGRRRGSCNGLPTMQTIAFEQCVVIRKKPWDPTDVSCKPEIDLETEASAMAHNGLFTIYPRGANLPQVIRLGTFVHELAHLWQFAYDFRNNADTRELKTNNLWLVPEFEKVLKPFGWTFPKLGEEAQREQIERYTQVLPRQEELTIHDDENITLNGSPLSVHQDALKYEGLVLSEWAKKHGNFSAYSLSSPWEWHADLFIAYLFLSMEAHIVKHTDSIPISGEFISWFRAQVLDNYDNQFYHPNLKDKVYQHFRNLIPIDELAMDELVCRYLINDSFVFSTLKHNSALPFAVKTPEEHVAEEIREQWKEYCPVQPSEA